MQITTGECVFFRALGLYIIYMVVFAGFGAGSGIGLFLHTSPGLQASASGHGCEVLVPMA
eukprot:1161937-Pelagomonas_calceolata.AAC.3